MPRTTVKKHTRKGTKGVKSHSRSTPKKKTVPHNQDAIDYDHLALLLRSKIDSARDELVYKEKYAEQFNVDYKDINIKGNIKRVEDKYEVFYITSDRYSSDMGTFTYKYSSSIHREITGKVFRRLRKVIKKSDEIPAYRKKIIDDYKKEKKNHA